ncbi:hypothetical protein [Paraburkholderia sp. DHOC27]|uniref:hypothetical protein n=1 Tax=Paraburkholderia sp. DHOC27 TaxID=2303330 RepID=UPI000E3CDEAF|nr:hypothetical protein [Paraburkholderia sp. DHOC27]RFU48028.1 hypothetical protein D0B32_10945 [Paraburkholderia sp. DHOC27]
MKIFKPRTPEPLPTGAKIQVYFASDRHRQPKALPALADALAAIDQEKVRLNAIIETGRGLSAKDKLRKSIAAITVAQNESYQAYTNAVARSDLSTAELTRSRHSTHNAERRRLQIELQRVEAADAAQTELNQLMRSLTEGGPL